MAICGLGIEEILAGEVKALGLECQQERGAVTFRGRWPDVWRANLRLRTANRVLVVLDRWFGGDGDALAQGARELVAAGKKSWDGVNTEELFAPHRSLSIQATSSRSEERDTRWIALRTKDGIVDGQRDRFGRRAWVDKRHAETPLRLLLKNDQATLLLDTSQTPLDRRGYRKTSIAAPLREQLAAACILASGWDGKGPIVDPMCGSGTLLIEAGWIGGGIIPGVLRERWAFERLPGFDEERFAAVRREEIPTPDPEAFILGVDQDAGAVYAAREHLELAGLADRSVVLEGDAFTTAPPPGEGIVAVNPAWGMRLENPGEGWKRLGDLFKKRYKGWRAVVLAGDESRGKAVGLKPTRRIPVRSGPLDARILIFDLW